jgi:steroid 5-alpha reductase family enzyme
MMSLFSPETPFFNCALATFVIQFFGFVVAFWFQTEVFYDIFGSGNFLLLGLWTFFSSRGTLSSIRSTATVLFLISRTWLLVFLGWRAHERKGDSRFDGVKNKAALFFVFWMIQGLWVYLISLPTIYINFYAPGDDEEGYSTSPYEKIVAVLFSLAIVVEVCADVQKAKWVRQGRVGKICTIGLWKYSRHPNYFGEMMMWLCSFLLMLPILLENPSVHGWSCILSPAFTWWLLLFASGTGITNAEGKGLKRYYENKNIADDYIAYRSKTSILIPMFGYAYLPMWFKRTFLFEWERYEYQASKNK